MGSNHRPLEYKTNALSTELIRHLIVYSDLSTIARSDKLVSDMLQRGHPLGYSPNYFGSHVVVLDFCVFKKALLFLFCLHTRLDTNYSEEIECTIAIQELNIQLTNTHF